MVQIDIPMPTNCATCRIQHNIGCNIAKDNGMNPKERDVRCPLKEQEAVEPSFSKIMKHFVCPNCSLVLDEGRDDYCPSCGKKIAWDEYYIHEDN